MDGSICFIFGFLFPIDIDECEQFGTCPQHCQNSKGSYECYCAEGFRSLSSTYGKRCEADGTYEGFMLELIDSQINACEHEIPENKLLSESHF